MKALLIPLGSHGDVHPLIGVGLELRSRGHEVTVISNVYFETLVRSQGLDFIGLQSFRELSEFFQHPDIFHPTRGWKITGRWATLDPMREVYETIARLYVPGETVVMAAYSAFGARIAQEHLGVPLATVVLEPDKLRSLHQTALMPRPLVLDDWVPQLAKRWQLGILDRFFIDRFVGPATNAFRAELGLPPVRRFLAEWCLSPDRVIGFFPEWFAPYQPDWPPQTVLTGFPLWDPDFAPEDFREVFEFLDSGDDPPIVFAPGTPMQHAHHFFSAASESCAALGRRGMLLTKYPQQLPTRLPAGVQHFSYVPFQAVLPRAAALVYHGGISSIGRVLATGIPQVLMPMAYNQPDDARRLKRLGVADVLPPNQFRGPRLTRVLGRLLDSQQVAARCRQLAGKFGGCHPVGQISDLLETLQGTDLRRSRMK
ncbi:MAG: glycosyltransferase [Planctomycetes bacterium]|nr:glycosyltransferase [Planctomycetota bacterium]